MPLWPHCLASICFSPLLIDLEKMDDRLNSLFLLADELKLTALIPALTLTEAPLLSDTSGGVLGALALPRLALSRRSASPRPCSATRP